jgi:hypothetical protein
MTAAARILRARVRDGVGPGPIAPRAIGVRRPAIACDHGHVIDSPVRMVLAALLVLSLASACEREQKAIERDLPASRVERARGDAQAVASAVRMYSATFGSLPDTLETLTTQTTKDGVSGGPFLRVLPTPPAGWSAYRYERKDDGTFSVTSAGEGNSVTVQ